MFFMEHVVSSPRWNMLSVVLDGTCCQ